MRNPGHRLIPGDRSTPKAGDYYLNAKAQAWDQLAKRFWKTWRHIENGDEYPADDMIAIAPGVNASLLRRELT